MVWSAVTICFMVDRNSPTATTSAGKRSSAGVLLLVLCSGDPIAEKLNRGVAQVRDVKLELISWAEEEGIVIEGFCGWALSGEAGGVINGGIGILGLGIQVKEEAGGLDHFNGVEISSAFEHESLHAFSTCYEDTITEQKVRRPGDTSHPNIAVGPASKLECAV